MLKRKGIIARILVLCMIATLVPVFAFVTPALAAGEGLLPNGSFETDANGDGTPDSWSKLIYGSATVGLDSTQFHEGAKSVKATGTNGTSSSTDRGFIRYTINNASNMNGYEYCFSIWQKTDNIVTSSSSTSNGTCVRVLFFDINGANVKPELFYKGATGTTEGWAQLKFNFFVPYGTTQILLEPALWLSSGTVWWDDASLAPTNLALNPGFEEDSNSDGKADNWITGTNAGTPVFSVSKSVYHAGAKSQMITGLSAADRGRVQQDFNVSQLNGSSLKLSVYQKTENITTALPTDLGTSVRLGFLNASGQTIVSNQSIPGNKGTTDGWKKITADVNIPEGTVTLRVELFLYLASGTVWWDDIQFQGFSQNLLSEPGMENDYVASGIPYAWKKSTVEGDPIFVIDNTVKKYGSKSFKITGDSTDDRVSINQDIIVQEGWSRSYKVSAYVKTENVVSSAYGSNIRILFKNAAGEILTDQIYVQGSKGTADWTRIEGSFLLPEAAKTITVQLYLWKASGTVWWDMAEVTPIQIDNPGFEKDDNSDGMADGWTSRVYAGSPTVTVSDSVYYEGSKSIRMSGSSITDNAKVTQTISIPGANANYAYKISMYYKTQDIALGCKYGAAMQVVFRNDAGQAVGSGKWVYGNRGTSDWEKLETSVSVPYGSTKLQIDAYLQEASGTVWWDKVEVTPVQSLYNGSFENDSDANNIPDSWVYSAESGSPLSALDTDEFYSSGSLKGIRSVRMTGTASGDTASLSQTFNLSGDFNHGGKFNVYYKVQDIVSEADHGAYAKLVFLDTNNIQVGNSLQVYCNTETKEWNALLKEFIPPVGAVKLKVQLYLQQATGTVWWDETEVVPASVLGLVPFDTLSYGDVFIEGRPRFSWRNVQNAYKYTLQYSQDPGFMDASTVTASNINATSYVIPAPLAEGTWYTRVKATDASNNTGPYGPVDVFYIKRLNISNEVLTPNDDDANDFTTLSYFVQEENTTVTVKIQDSNNRTVKTLVNAQLENTGFKEVIWDGKNDGGTLVADGSYTAKLTFNISGQVYESSRPVAVNAADTSGYRGLENNKDWSGFYRDWMQKTATAIINDLDSTGRYVRGNGAWQVAENAAYAFILANEYHSSSSSLYGNTTVRNNAIKAFDWCLAYEKENFGSWSRERREDPNIDRFALNPLAEAFMLLKDDVDPVKRQEWLDLLVRAAYYQKGYYTTDVNPVGRAGNYPNMDAGYTLALALVGTIAGDQVLKDEAHRMALLMEDDISANGGFYYYIGVNPVPNYQHINLLFLARYYQITGDADIPRIINKTVDYFPTVAQLNGTFEYGTCPELKQAWFDSETFIGADVVAYFANDGRNKMVANIMKEQFSRKYPNAYLPSLHHMYMRYIANDLYSEVLPVKLTDYGVMKDPDINGFRGRWGEFSAAVTPSKISNTLATATITNDGNPLAPKDSFLANVLFESDSDDYYYMVAPGQPTINNPAYQAGVIHRKVYANKVGAQHLKYVPTSYEGWFYVPGTEGDWGVQQTWIIFENRLIGMNTMEALNSSSGEFARSRLVFGNTRYVNYSTEINGDDLYGNYKDLGFWLNKETDPDWEFNPDIISIDEPGTVNSWHSAKDLAIQKKETLPGVVSWNTGDKVSYNAVFFPLGSHSSAKAWHDDENANNIRFSRPQTDVHAVQMNTQDGSNEVYVVITNHTSATAAANMSVTLANGTYTLVKYVDDTGVPASSADITVSGGSYSLGYSLNADSVVTYKFAPAPVGLLVNSGFETASNSNGVPGN